MGSSSTTRNTWKTRNDSSNMSAILAPNNCQNSDQSFHKTKKPIIYSNSKKKSQRQQQRHKGHCQTCYCHQTPQPPLMNLNRRRQTSDPVAELRKKIESKNECCCLSEDDGEVSAKSEELLKEVHKKLDYIPRTIFLRRLKEEAHKNCCSFTQQREDYEDLVEEREEQSIVNEEDNATSVRLRGGNDCDCAKCSADKTLRENAKKVSSIKDFRKSNYFETHSAADLLAHHEVGDHKCVHKFTLDERMVPIPENRDAYGLSRCVICNKPMVEEDLSKKKSVAKSAKATITDKEYKGLVSLEPKRLYVPVKDELVEVRLPLDLDVDEDKVGVQFKKLCRPVPVSSVALRFQKGVFH